MLKLLVFAGLVGVSRGKYSKQPLLVSNVSGWTMDTTGDTEFEKMPVYT